MPAGGSEPPPPPRDPRETLDLSGDAFAPLTPAVRFAFTVGPPAGFVLILFLAAVLTTPGTAGFLASMAVGTFVGGGKLVILAGAVEQAPVGPWALAALIVYIDLATALLVFGGMHRLYRIPGAGRRIARAREAGWRMLRRRPWMYRVAWLGLAAFVAVPFHGTGAFVGAVLGRLMGLSRRSILAATGFGSAVGSSVLALAGDYWEERITALAARPFLGVVVVTVVVAAMVLASRWVMGRADQDGAEVPPRG